jgi:hypothetical protein
MSPRFEQADSIDLLGVIRKQADITWQLWDTSRKRLVGGTLALSGKVRPVPWQFQLAALT